MGALHILIADDHRLFRKGLIAALKQARPEWLFTEAENGQEAFDYVRHENSTALVLLDVSMPVMNGLEACFNIKQVNPDLPIIMLTQFDERSLILHFLQIGVNGYLLKNSDPEKVIEAIEMVMQTGKYITEQIIEALEASVGTAPRNKVRLNLSSRDKEIIHLLGRGKSTKEIAGHMHLTETSIESYRKDLLHKTRTHNVAELISFAHRTGVLSTYSENKV